MRLFIAEKPSLAKAIAEGLDANPIKNSEGGFFTAGQDRVTWAVGHLLEQVKPDVYDPALKKWSYDTLPFVPDKWKLTPIDRTAKQLSNIGQLLKSCSSVVNAGDPDREGQLLIDEILEHFNYKGKEERVWLSAIDPKSVATALKTIKPNSEYKNLKDSALARSRADWLIGFNLTRAYTITSQKFGYSSDNPPVSIGRVQTPVLALIVKRELEIRDFKPLDFYTVTANIAVANGSFNGKLKLNENSQGVNPEGKLIDPVVASNIVKLVKGSVGKITRFETKREADKAPLPFNLSSLQIYASSRWGYGAQDVLNICQSLYETHKIATYPRSDCEYLPLNQLADAPLILKSISNAFQSALKANTSIKSKAWNDSKVTAHHGIIPTSKVPNMAALSQPEKDIYEVICLHYIAQFYSDYLYDKTNIEASFGSPAQPYVFAATGRVDVDQGWRAVLPARTGKSSKAKLNNEEEDDEQSIPKASLNDPAKANDCKAEAKKTKPPSRFTEGTLIHAMTNIHLYVTEPEIKAKLKETDGLGTEATRANILKTIVDRKMVYMEKKNFVPTEMGFAVIAAAPQALKNPGLTALWEGGLSKISTGEMIIDNFIDMQVKALNGMVAFAKTVVINVPASSKVSSGSSKGSSSAYKGKSGQSFKKSPGSKFEKKAGSTDKPKYVHPVTSLGKCPACGKAIILRTAKTGPNEGKQFHACSGFPECKQRIDQPKSNDSAGGGK